LIYSFSSTLGQARHGSQQRLGNAHLTLRRGMSLPPSLPPSCSPSLKPTTHPPSLPPSLPSLPQSLESPPTDGGDDLSSFPRRRTSTTGSFGPGMERPHRGIHRFWKVREGGRDEREGGKGDLSSFPRGGHAPPAALGRAWRDLVVAFIGFGR